MKKLITIAVLLLLQATAIRAQYVIDSLTKLLNTVKGDIDRVSILTSISRAYIYSKPDSALFFGQQGLELSRRINYKSGESRCLRVTASVFMNTGNYPKALEIDLEALKIAEESKDLEIIGVTFGSLSDVYFYEGDIKRSLEYSSKAISIYETIHDSARLGTVITNVGDTYEKSNQLDSALIYVRRGYAIAMALHYPELVAISIGNMGNVMMKLEKNDSAMFYLKSAEPYFRQSNNDEGLSENFLGRATLFLRQKKIDSSLYYAKLSFNLAASGGFIDKELAASSFLSEYYKSVNNVDSAYAYQSATIAAKDSMFSQEKSNQIQGMTYDESLRQQQIEEARAHERAKLKQGLLLGGLGALIVVIFLLYLNNRQKRKANVQLSRQKDEIDEKAHQLAVQKESLEQSYNNVELLGDIGRKITSSLSVEKIISTVYNNVNALMDANVFGIGIYNDDLKRIEFASTYEEGEALPFYFNSISDKNRFASICFTSGKEIIMGNLDKEHKAYIQEVPTPHEGSQPVSIIFLPLTIKEKKLGVITVQSFQENAYSDYHLYMLRNIATYTAIALYNAESYEELIHTVGSLKSTQAQLIHAEKMASLGELTAGIAHEIQNPLNFVNNFSEVNRELIEEIKIEIQKNGLGNKEIEIDLLNNIDQNLEKISFHGKRADGIVKGMLQHSRASTGQKEATDMNVLCDEYLRLAYHGLRAKDKSFNTKFEVDLDPSLEKINVAPQDIGRVILNLINNAFYSVTEKRATAGEHYEPFVTISTKKLNGGVQIRVKDNGNGIPQKVLDKIFQPFFTTKPTGQGTGLGLSLSYDIIKAHGGNLKVETRENEGSEFIIEIWNNN
ncbi:MAG TPA: ATP-binding protein [Chitinophagaceae bacterium]